MPGLIIHRYKGWSRWRKSDFKTKRKKVVIYAAGTVGQKIYHLANGEAGYKVIAWIDKDYKVYRKQRYPVSGVQSIGKKKFDMIIIAIKNAQVVQSVTKMLIEEGISPEKIFDATSFYAMVGKN